MPQDFKRLKVWEKAHQFTLEVYRLTNKFPVSEQFGIVSQLRRASASIGANISEGCGRRTQKDFASFMYNSLGSTKECENHLLLSKDLGYLKEQEFIDLTKQAEEIGKMLNALIHAIV
jgi:four helix bundle protein